MRPVQFISSHRVAEVALPLESTRTFPLPNHGWGSGVGRIFRKGWGGCCLPLEKNTYWLPSNDSLILVGCLPFYTNEKYSYLRSLSEVDRYPSKQFGTPHSRLNDTTLNDFFCAPDRWISLKHFLQIPKNVFCSFKDFDLRQIDCKGFSSIVDGLCEDAQLRGFQEFVRIFKSYLVVLLFRTGFFSRGVAYKYSQKSYVLKGYFCKKKEKKKKKVGGGVPTTVRRGKPAFDLNLNQANMFILVCIRGGIINNAIIMCRVAEPSHVGTGMSLLENLPTYLLYPV